MLSYSFHISNGKNAINNKKSLKRASDHNHRKYKKSNCQEMDLDLSVFNTTLVGSDNIYQDVKKFYNDYFKDALYEYNSNQRESRKIYDYFEKISEDKQKHLAVEVIIQIGDKDYWQDKNTFERTKMTDVFKEQIKFLEKELPNFKILNAVIHYDESSPHIQIVGVPIAENKKNGMRLQVSKKSIFTKQKLIELQDTMRKNCIKSFNKVYRTNEVLKTKENGRNKDFTKDEYKDYIENKKMLDELKQEINNLLNTKNELERELENYKEKKQNLINDELENYKNNKQAEIDNNLLTLQQQLEQNRLTLEAIDEKKKQKEYKLKELENYKNQLTYDTNKLEREYLYLEKNNKTLAKTCEELTISLNSLKEQKTTAENNYKNTINSLNYSQVNERIRTQRSELLNALDNLDKTEAISSIEQFKNSLSQSERIFLTQLIEKKISPKQKAYLSKFVKNPNSAFNDFINNHNEKLKELGIIKDSWDIHNAKQSFDNGLGLSR